MELIGSFDKGSFDRVLCGGGEWGRQMERVEEKVEENEEREFQAEGILLQRLQGMGGHGVMR